jgi:copper chaperone CopZ
VKAALEGLPGVNTAEVDLETGTAKVRTLPELTGEEAVDAVRHRVILPWARGLLARTLAPGRGRL